MLPAKRSSPVEAPWSVRVRVNVVTLWVIYQLSRGIQRCRVDGGLELGVSDVELPDIEDDPERPR